MTLEKARLSFLDRYLTLWIFSAKVLLESKGLRSAHAILQKAAGFVIIGIGLYFLFWR